MSESLSFQDPAEFTDPEGDERAHWARVESDVLRLCAPLAHMITHKSICAAVDVSGGQLSRELSPHHDNRLSLAVGLYILRRTQHQQLARVVICDGASYRLPDPQRRRVTETEELRALRATLSEEMPGDVGASLIDKAKRRARSGR